MQNLPNYTVQNQYLPQTVISASGLDKSAGLAPLHHNRSNFFPQARSKHLWLDQRLGELPSRPSRLLSHLCIHSCSSFISLMHNHHSLLHRHLSSIYHSSQSIHSICGLPFVLISLPSDLLSYLLHQMLFVYSLHMPEPSQHSLLCSITHSLKTPVLLCTISSSCNPYMRLNTQSSDTTPPLHSVSSLLLPHSNFQLHTALLLLFFNQHLTSFHSHLHILFHLFLSSVVPLTTNTPFSSQLFWNRNFSACPHIMPSSVTIPSTPSCFATQIFITIT